MSLTGQSCRGAAEALEVTGRRHLVASAIEHEAVLNTLKALARRGWRTTLLTVDQSGNYRVALAPGNYVLDIQDRVAKHIRAASRPFTVVSNQTVHVDMNVVIGMHRLQPVGADR